MKLSERDRIKTKINSIESQRWWGDDFDIRFYLISELKKIRRKNILDVGGGIGIICSELNNSNTRVNLDLSQKDLKICKEMVDKNIRNVCASMTNLPFKENFFDVVICSHLLEIAKQNDIENNQVNNDGAVARYPTIEKTLNEISRVLRTNGRLFITTPNNSYYKTIKLDFEELNESVTRIFPNSKINFFNTHSRVGTSRKLNMANTIPKFTAKIFNPDKVISNLLKEKSKNGYSVSFYVQAIKDLN